MSPGTRVRVHLALTPYLDEHLLFNGPVGLAMANALQILVLSFSFQSEWCCMFLDKLFIFGQFFKK